MPSEAVLEQLIKYCFLPKDFSIAVHKDELLISTYIQISDGPFGKIYLWKLISKPIPPLNEDESIYNYAKNLEQLIEDGIQKIFLYFVEKFGSPVPFGY